MEKEITLKSRDKKKIFLKIRGSFHQPVVILVHGLAGHMDEALHYNAAKYFQAEGFTVVRFNLYSWQTGARKLSDCTLNIHGQDIDVVTNYLIGKGVKKVFIVGHSYGAPSILHSNYNSFSGIVFWDGSYHTIKNYFKKLKFVPDLNGRIMNDGYEVIIGEAMVQEALKFNSNKLVSRLNTPLQIICAEKNNLVKAGKSMFKSAKTIKAFGIIKDAEHNFSKEGVQEKLFQATAHWLKQL